MRFAFAWMVGPILLAGSTGCALLSGVGDLAIVDCDGACVGAGDDAIDATTPDASVHDAHPGDGGNGGNGDAQADATASETGTGGNDGSSGSTDGSSDAKSDAEGGSTTGPCPGTAGPTPVRVGSFCIDSTEVTNDQYAAFLASNPVSGLAPPACAFRTSFVPSAGWPAQSGKGSYPVVYVDWCDAYAYCAYAGKRMCGAIGGGASSRAKVADKTVDEWYVACSANGANVYPYGGTQFSAGKCNEYEASAKALRPAASFPGCVGGYPGIYDMNGSVWEWEDACDVSAGASDACLIRGGAFDYTGADYGGCPTYFNDYVVKRSDNFNDTGIRCCSK